MKKYDATYRLLYKLLYIGRDTLWRDIFTTVRIFCHGDVLDIGGRDFFLKVSRNNPNIKTWTTIEPTNEESYPIHDKRYRFVLGDGCDMTFKSNSFDTVINFHVLEHIMEPNTMVKEAARVLKKKGIGLFLIPQTATLHMGPDHYYNFTRFWIERVMKENKLDIIELKPLGGLWKTVTARFFYFFLMSSRVEGMSFASNKRSIFFYLLFPFMALYAVINIPLCLFFSLGDLTEDANDHLVVVKKRA